MSSCFEDEKTYSCPICGQQVDGDYVYVDGDGDIAGCEYCLSRHAGCDILKSDQEIEQDHYDNFMAHSKMEEAIA